MPRNTLRPILLSLLPFITSSAYGACIPDAPEIGDIGPESQQICKLLESQFQQSDIIILDREIHSADSVSVVFSLNGQRQSQVYDLKQMTWSPRVMTAHKR